MPFFPCAHASNSSWKLALKQVEVQLSAQISMQKLDDQPCLGLVYISQNYADAAAEMVVHLSKAFPQVRDWVGCAGYSVLAGDLDYGHAGALAVMLTYVPAHSYQVFSGQAPQLRQNFAAHFALVHGEASPSLAPQQLDLLRSKLSCQHLVGGVSDLQAQHVQWALGSGHASHVQHIPASIGGGGMQMGGLSGVVFEQGVDCMFVGMQACKPQGSRYAITKIDADGQVVLELDGRDALDVLACEQLQRSVQTLGDSLVAISPADVDIYSDCVPPQAQVIRVSGVDQQRRGIVLNGKTREGCALSLCEPDAQATRSDVRRACAQVWDALTSEPPAVERDSASPAVIGRSISGAIYIRNRARQPVPNEPQLDVELELIRHTLGPVPLMGFTSTYEVDGPHLQHLSAQLLVFTQPMHSFA